jgi:hypothetical protein
VEKEMIQQQQESDRKEMEILKEAAKKPVLFGRLEIFCDLLFQSASNDRERIFFALHSPINIL